MEILLAIVIGGLFGFVLHRAGAADPRNIIDMLRLKDFHLMKVILFAIGFSSLLLFAFIAMGIVQSAHLSVKTTHVGVFVGGLIFGAGFAIGGYCPGTCLVSAGSGRKDAFSYISGGLVGAFLFTISFGALSDTFLFSELWGGKATLADTRLAPFTAVIETVPAPVVAGAIALVFMLIAWKLPLREKRRLK